MSRADCPCADDISRDKTGLKMSAPTESTETQMEESSGDQTVTNVSQEDVEDTQPDVTCKGDGNAAGEDTQPDVTCKGDGNAAGAALSKSQLKKLKKKEKWEQVKAQKRKAEKERYKARKRECRERGEELGPTRKQLRHNKMSKSSCKVQVVIDCDFDNFMADKDIKMLVKQIQYSYSANRRAENPLQFHCCGVNGKTRERLENIGDYKGWDIKFHSESFTELFEKSSVVYLSSESSNTLETLEEDRVYVIGGLVDHNHHKGLCHKLAEEKGLAHAQLPITDYIDMKTRKVLTVNHVFEILLRFTETKDWQKAFYTVLPPRKGATPKLQNSSGILPSVLTDQEYGNSSSGKQAENDSKSPADDSEDLICGVTEEVGTHKCEMAGDCKIEDKKEDSVYKSDLQNEKVDHLDDKTEGEQCCNNGTEQL